MPRGRPEEREALARAAFTLFAEQGVEHTSVEDICESAGLDEIAFQQHFESKGQLVRALLEEGSKAHLDRLHAADRSDAPFEEKLAHLARERWRVRRELRAIVLSAIREGGALARSVEELRQENRERITAFLVAAQERGELRDDIDPELVLALLEKVDELQGDEKLVQHVGDEGALLETALDIFFHGVLAGQGATSKAAQAEGSLQPPLVSARTRER